MVAPALIHFKLWSLKDDTFEKLFMIKSNHHSKSVNNLKIADQLRKILSTRRALFYCILLCGMLIIYEVCRQIGCMMNQKFKF